jgi:hypothetical protein
MKKTIYATILLSIISSSVVVAAGFKTNGKEVLSNHPLLINYRSIEQGGSNYAIDMYKDGIGVFVANSPNSEKINNSAMNNLVFKYGEKAKTLGTTLVDYIIVPENTAAEDKEKVKELTQNQSEDRILPNCEAILLAKPDSVTGQYYIDPDGPDQLPAINVTCDMETAGGGWIVTTPNDLVTKKLSFTKVNGYDAAQVDRIKNIVNTNVNNLRKEFAWSGYFIDNRDSAGWTREKYWTIPSDMPVGSKVRLSGQVQTWSGDSDTSRMYLNFVLPTSNTSKGTQTVDTGYQNWASGYWTTKTYNRVYDDSSYNRVRLHGGCKRVYGSKCSGWVANVKVLFNYDLPASTDTILIK